MRLKFNWASTLAEVATDSMAVQRDTSSMGSTTDRDERHEFLFGNNFNYGDDNR
jgi:hypothetical protein